MTTESLERAEWPRTLPLDPRSVASHIVQEGDAETVLRLDENCRQPDFGVIDLDDEVFEIDGEVWSIRQLSADAIFSPGVMEEWPPEVTRTVTHIVEPPNGNRFHDSEGTTQILGVQVSAEITVLEVAAEWVLESYDQTAGGNLAWLLRGSSQTIEGPVEVFIPIGISGDAHINFYGRYDFTNPQPPPNGTHRPLRVELDRPISSI